MFIKTYKCPAKADKIYIENTAFVHALQPRPETGTLRETLFLNQLRNSGYVVELSTKGDFPVDGTYTFEVGAEIRTCLRSVGWIMLFWRWTI